ncbi:MAG: hypothetical protein PHQ35_03865 [Phycisphaerae bacterium]|nr:hypothetical protein [Phycisphaerae bacterium]MDD5380572.1 hypothetical protein [Phycisphaerae bacterium]
MHDEQIKKMIDDIYDDSRENTLRSMIGDFYNRKMFSIVVLVWIWAIIFIGGAIYSGIQFFNTDLLREQIMYAVIFLCCFQGIAMIKIFAWQIIHKNSLKREVKRLELRIAELAETVKNK